MGLWLLGILLVYLVLGWSRRRADFASARLDLSLFRFVTIYTVSGVDGVGSVGILVVCWYFEAELLSHRKILVLSVLNVN